MHLLFNLVVLAIVVACPLSMLRMMRKGGHGGHAMHMPPPSADAAAVQQRVSDLEGEVARLRAQPLDHRDVNVLPSRLR